MPEGRLFEESTQLELGDFTLDFDDATIGDFLTPGRVADLADRADLSPSGELRDVTRRIASQYLEILLMTASGLFTGRDARGGASRLLVALDALERLARAAADEDHQALLAEMRPQAAALALEPRGRVRDVFLARFRPWLVRYGEYIGGVEGERFRALVAYDESAVPLFSELAAIQGIGPRRLERLFCAGLYAVDVVCEADPVEVAAVTGLPRALAADVIRRARGFQEAHKRRTVLEMKTRIMEFQRVLGALDPHGSPELWALAQAAVADIQGVVSQLVEERR